MIRDKSSSESDVEPHYEDADLDMTDNEKLNLFPGKYILFHLTINIILVKVQNIHWIFCIFLFLIVSSDSDISDSEVNEMVTA